MKQLLKLLLIILVAGAARGQDCTSFAPMTEGSKYEITNYDKKGNVDGVSKNEVIKADGNSAQIKMEMLDKKGKTISEGEFAVKCEDGVFYIDMSMFLDPSQMEAYKDMDVTMDASFLEFPANMKAGDQLPDGAIELKFGTEGTTIATIKMTIMNRVVHATETVKTDAGSFECQKITYDYETKIGFIKVKGSAVLWMAKDVGMVKSESYNKKGKLVGSSALTKLEKS